MSLVALYGVAQLLSVDGEVLVIDRLPQLAVLKENAGIECSPVLVSLGGIQNNVVSMKLRILGTAGGMGELSNDEIFCSFKK